MSGALSALSRVAGQYLQCSFRAIPFAVMGSGGEHGRKQAVHQYPYRDGLYVEDLGMRGRAYHVRGFVTGPTASAQRDLLVNAAETAGPGLLIHPTLGVIRASCMNFAWSEPDGIMGRIDISFDFLEETDLLGGVLKMALDVAVAAAAIVAQSTASNSFIARITSSLAVGQPVVLATRAVAAGWGVYGHRALHSPVATQAAMSTLPGNNGRYAAGNNTAIDPDATAGTALEALVSARTDMESALAALTQSTTPRALAENAQTLVELVRNSLPDPGAQIAALLVMAGFVVQPESTTAPIGAAIATGQSAMAALCQHMALASLALACESWQPTSSNEAESLRRLVSDKLDIAATQAADAGLTDIWQVLRSLRSALTTELSDRASQLPEQITVTRNEPVPALLLAQQLYADGTRSDDLIRRANPIHPAFMPTSFEALSA
ncbi:DNA circularization protein [Acetobacter orientalis]|uniref:DNA circularization protein n=1 Tax=Acetobacter orientalis TaxID=146474 RepID=UPI0039EB3941